MVYMFSTSHSYLLNCILHAGKRLMYLAFCFNIFFLSFVSLVTCNKFL